MVYWRKRMQRMRCSIFIVVVVIMAADLIWTKYPVAPLGTEIQNSSIFVLDNIPVGSNSTKTVPGTLINMRLIARHVIGTETDQPMRVCTQQERLDHVTEICQKRSQAMRGSLAVPKKSSIVDHKHKVLMCWISKVGCTAFKALMLEANGYNKVDHLGHNLMPVHSTEILAKHGLYALGSQTSNITQIIMQDYFKFMLIRHPFERLISTYRGKVQDLSSDFPHFGAETLKLVYPELFANNRTLREMKKPQLVLGSPSFGEFLGWIAETKSSNRHWDTLTDGCHPCANAWTAVMRLETMEHDSTLLIDQLQPDVDVEKIPIRHSHQEMDIHDHDHLRLLEFDDVDDDVIDYFLSLYEVDMDMFGYHWDRKSRTASCYIETPQGQCC